MSCMRPALSLVASPRIVVADGDRREGAADGRIGAAAERRAKRPALIERPGERPPHPYIALEVQVLHAVNRGLASSIEIGICCEKHCGAETVPDVRLHRRDQVLFA